MPTKALFYDSGDEKNRFNTPTIFLLIPPDVAKCAGCGKISTCS